MGYYCSYSLSNNLDNYSTPTMSLSLQTCSFEMLLSDIGEIKDYAVHSLAELLVPNPSGLIFQRQSQTQYYTACLAGNNPHQAF